MHVIASHPQEKGNYVVTIASIELEYELLNVIS
jgi:hypothetical protein